jgi:hypothetical protein
MSSERGYDKNGSVRRVHISPYFKSIDSGGMIWQFFDDSSTASFIMGFRSPIACASTLLSRGESLRIAAKECLSQCGYTGTDWNLIQMRRG